MMRPFGDWCGSIIVDKFYIEDINNVYGCFRCGEVMGDVGIIDEHMPYCKECGEMGILSFRQALDIVNDFHRTGDLILSEEEQDYEEVLRIIEEEENNSE